MQFERTVMYLGYTRGVIQRDNKVFYTVQLFDPATVSPVSVTLMEDKTELVSFFTGLESTDSVSVTFALRPDREHPKLYKLSVADAVLV